MARRRVFQRAAVRRRTSWEGVSLQQVSTTGVVLATSVVSEAILENVPNPTIVRIRGELLLHVTARGANVSESTIFMGIKLVTATAFAAGVASIESPGTDIGSDWIWWGVRSFATLTAQPAATDSNGEMLTTRVPIDSKAMRKVEVNKLLVFVSENSVVTSTQTVTITGSARVLLKL